MPEQTELTFTLKEVVTALLKAQDIHEGIWGLHVKFGLRGMTLGATPADVLPTALLGVMSLSINKSEQVSNIAVDAAEANPRPAPIAENATPKRIGAGRTTKAGRKSDR